MPSIWPFMIRRVEGDSMLPLLKQNDLVIAIRIFKPKPGDVVIAKINNTEIIKRVKNKDSYGNWWLEGDNPDMSTDSRSFGAFKRNELLSRVIYPRLLRK